MLKKTLCAVLIFAMLLTFAGCKSGKKDDNLSDDEYVYYDESGEEITETENVDGDSASTKEEKKKSAENDDEEVVTTTKKSGSSKTGESGEKTTTDKKTEEKTTSSKKTSTCNHKWQPATCTKASYCSRCLETKGSPLGHDTEGEATCTKGLTCKRCNKEAVAPLGHTYKNGECIRCHIKETDDLKALYIGDSISYGEADLTKGFAWAGRIERDHNIKATNVSCSGWTLCDRYGGIYNELDRATTDNYGYVIMHGGFNDCYRDNYEIPFGTVTPNGTTTFDLSTAAGGLEQLFSEVTKRYPKAKKGFIINYTIDRDYPPERLKQFTAIAKQVCDKWGIPYLELDAVTGLHSQINSKLADGLHPTAAGYEILTPVIYNWMLTL